MSTSASVRTGLVVAGVLVTAGARPAAPVESSPPPLVVFIAVDQMRFDYLERFGDLYDGGLARLLKGGLVFTNVHHTHALTGTAPGHATLVTGVVPARHGIPANRFFDRTAGRFVYAVEDTAARTVGMGSGAAGRSPKQLEAATVGDWLKAASPESKVLSLAAKDRVAVLMAGRRADGAYWYHDGTGRFVTSSYYRSELPPWLEAFNAGSVVQRYAASGWQKLREESAYARAREDSFPAEAGGKGFVFPHTIGDDGTPPEQGIALTPFLDVVVLELARLLVREEELGRDSIPDLLLLGLASGDAIGHEFGPLSQEMEDYYLRLDQALGEFFEFLDREVGSGRYVVVLTADHGAPYLPEENHRRGIPAGRVTLADLQPVLVPALERGLFELEISEVPQVGFAFPYGLALAFPAEAITPAKLKELRRRLAGALREAPGVADAFTFDELLDPTVEERPFLAAYRASFFPDRAPDVMVHFERNYFFTTTLPLDHGTPYDYDTHVPLVVLGAGIAAGRRTEAVAGVDIAPTVARLLGIEAPAADGRAVEVRAARPGPR